MANRKRGSGKKVIVLLALGCFITVGVLGWNWLNGLVCRSIIVAGEVHADADEVIAAARVDTGGALFEIDPVLVADRVNRLPWVRSAEVTRLPPGTLSIRVRERVPVALALSADGVPSVYLDADGYAMPVTENSTSDQPLITGVRVPTNPGEPVERREVRELMRSIASLPDETDVLISSFVVEPTGEIALRTVPIHGNGSVSVRLGRDDFDEKLKRLHAFWHQAVLTRPDRTYDVIDLRFDSQIVTRETKHGDAPADSDRRRVAAASDLPPAVFSRGD